MPQTVFFGGGATATPAPVASQRHHERWPQEQIQETDMHRVAFVRAIILAPADRNRFLRTSKTISTQ
jgi:hypothetical protein